MPNPLDPADGVHRMLVRKGETTAKGGPAFQRLLQLAETRDSGQVRLDARLLVDIDLAMPSNPAKRFERDDQDVCKEYAWVPGFRCQELTAQVLKSFLDRPRLYLGEYAVALLEAQARINLAAAPARLAQ